MIERAALIYLNSWGHTSKTQELTVKISGATSVKSELEGCKKFVYMQSRLPFASACTPQMCDS